ncbi:hypothetical protein [Kitasatospora sp. NPDC094015]|uniref:hypothetical protein n=1 Tax=Kitasatospora sp. NPDC094015 TaxID=3155205 RepID=UPI003320883B
MLERAGGHRTGKAVVLGCLTAIVAGAAVVFVLCSGVLAPAPGEHKDRAACSSSFREFDQESGYFDLTLPTDSVDLRHDSVTGPFFDRFHLMATFTTTPDGLREFLTTGGLPAPAPAPGSAPLSGCGAPAGGPFTETVRTSGGRQVTVQVYETDPARPLVVLRAED